MFPNVLPRQCGARVVLVVLQLVLKIHSIFVSVRNSYKNSFSWNKSLTEHRTGHRTLLLSWHQGFGLFFYHFNQLWGDPPCCMWDWSGSILLVEELYASLKFYITIWVFYLLNWRVTLLLADFLVFSIICSSLQTESATNEILSRSLFLFCQTCTIKCGGQTLKELAFKVEPR